MGAAERMIRLLEMLVEQGRQNQRNLSVAPPPAQVRGDQSQAGASGRSGSGAYLDTFPKPGILSRPMSDELQQNLAHAYLRRPADVYGASTRLAGSLGGLVPGAGSLALGMARIR
jgi:hypothetical protein